MPFKISSPYKPAGDQPQAIDRLVSGLNSGHKRQTLLGVTGSGKTFTIANVIEKVQRPTLVIAHNKTLAAQLCNEFREFFPNNAVEYFVSYYDYYQPEAYIAASDTYIEKETQINEEIDRLRHAATQAILTRPDTIIVASVSCIYNLGSPKEYEQIVLHLQLGQRLDRRGMLAQLVQMQFERTNSDLRRGTFRMHGQVFEVMPVNEEVIWRLEISDRIDRIEKLHAVSRKVLASTDNRQTSKNGPKSEVRSTEVQKGVDGVWLFPAKHYVASPELKAQAIASVRAELKERLAFFDKHGKLLEAERLKRKVNYDMEMIDKLGYCSGIENYSRYFDGRPVGAAPFSLLEYFRHGAGENFLVVIDESHVMVPQVRAMYHGDRARKESLIEHGFRLPSAFDNRPLTFDEFSSGIPQAIFVSATPSEFEQKESQQVVEQIVRPTGLVDPEVIIQPISTKQSKQVNSGGVLPLTGGAGGGPSKVPALGISPDPSQASPVRGGGQLSQVGDVILRIEERIKMGERALVTTLTKKMAEDLTDFLKEKGIKVQYLHSDVDTLDRIEIITGLRKGEFDVIVGVNLLREGLDIPEVSLVAILDADKEGFLRSETSLIQTIGRAARNVNGQVVLYADQMTGSIERAISETDRRRAIQLQYNTDHGITPKTIQKNIRNILEDFGISNDKEPASSAGRQKGKRPRRLGGGSSVLDLDLLGDARPIRDIIKDKEQKMRDAAQALEFELAAILRDEVRELRAREKTGEKRNGSPPPNRGS